MRAQQDADAANDINLRTLFGSGWRETSTPPIAADPVGDFTAKIPSDAGRRLTGWTSVRGQPFTLLVRVDRSGPIPPIPWRS